jgi:cytochrome P450
MRRSFLELGPMIVIAEPLPLLKNLKVAGLGLPIVVATGSEFNREVLGNPGLWRPVGIFPGGPKGSAARRLSAGLARMTGRRHAHYRRLLVPDLLAQKWSLQVWALPLNLPVTPYGKLLRHGEALERCILNWADEKRGQLDGNDLLSIVVNNPEEDGKPLSDSTIVGHMPQLFGAAFETCQNVLIWTLVLLAQHPAVASKLYDELRDSVNGMPLSLERVVNLPWLDQVIKESLRILPPVPMQLRVAEEATSLAGQAVPKGTRVLLSPFVTNRAPELYAGPDRFDPERWTAINPTPFEYLVFSAGSRNCPGALFGSAMLKTAIAAILLRFGLQLAPQAQIDYTVRPALTPRRTVPAELRAQDGKFRAAPIRGNISGLVDFPNGSEPPGLK